MTDAVSWLQDSVAYQFLVVAVGKFEFYNLRTIHIQMCELVSVIFNRNLRWLKLSNVDASGANVVVDMLGQLLKVVEWIIALLQLGPELIIDGLFVLSLLDFFLSLLFFLK